MRRQLGTLLAVMMLCCFLPLATAELPMPNAQLVGQSGAKTLSTDWGPPWSLVACRAMSTQPSAPAGKSAAALFQHRTVSLRGPVARAFVAE